MISVLILTRNEEANLPRCLDSLSWARDVVVLDSFSTDNTVQIAESRGARVIQRAFDDWASHQNWALENIQFQNPWVYYSDADEVVTPELAREMAAAVPGSSHAAYRVRFKNYFMGRWLRHSSLYPTWVLRLFQPAKVRWERLVNPVAVVNGSQGKLRNHFLHYSFHKGLHAWIAKHNQYSTAEAEETIRGPRVFSGAELVARDAAVRRHALKQLSLRLPCRPALRFLYMYFGRLGFLDGVPGFHYCLLLAFYEYLISLKTKEIRRRRQTLPL